MSRAVVAVDRLVLGLVGLLLLAAGTAAAAWQTGVFGGSARSVAVGVPGAGQAPGQAWWPWALAVAGILLVALGVRWLVAHLPRGAGRTTLPGTVPTGHLTLDLQPVAAAAATELATFPGVRSAHGRAVEDRGRVVVRVIATVEPDASLVAVGAAADEITRHVRLAVGPDLPVRVHVRSAGSRRERRQVR